MEDRRRNGAELIASRALQGGRLLGVKKIVGNIMITSVNIKSKMEEFDENPREVVSLADRLRIPVSKKNSSIHSEIHDLADKCYKNFGETAKKGKGSFGFYLGFIKRLGVQSTYRIIAELRADGKEHAGKLFWYKVKKEFEARGSARRRAEMGVSQET
jgi:hypothetical protein